MYWGGKTTFLTNKCWQNWTFSYKEKKKQLQISHLKQALIQPAQYEVSFNCNMVRERTLLGSSLSSGAIQS